MAILQVGCSLKTHVNTLKESKDAAFQGSQGILPGNLKTYVFGCIFSILPLNEASKTLTT